MMGIVVITSHYELSNKPEKPGIINHQPGIMVMGSGE